MLAPDVNNIRAQTRDVSSFPTNHQADTTALHCLITNCKSNHRKLGKLMIDDAHQGDNVISVLHT